MVLVTQTWIKSALLRTVMEKLMIALPYVSAFPPFDLSADVEHSGLIGLADRVALTM